MTRLVDLTSDDAEQYRQRSAAAQKDRAKPQMSWADRRYVIKGQRYENDQPLCRCEPSCVDNGEGRGLKCGKQLAEALLRPRR